MKSRSCTTLTLNSKLGTPGARNKHIIVVNCRLALIGRRRLCLISRLWYRTMPLDGHVLTPDSQFLRLIYHASPRI